MFSSLKFLLDSLSFNSDTEHKLLNCAVSVTVSITS